MNCSPRSHILFLAGCLALLLGLAGCEFSLARRTAPIASQEPLPETWFEAPANGAELSLDPYIVVIRASDTGGIAEVTLLIDGHPQVCDLVLASAPPAVSGAAEDCPNCLITPLGPAGRYAITPLAPLSPQHLSPILPGQQEEPGKTTPGQLSPQSTAEPVSVKCVWDSFEAGRHVLRARSRNLAGAWSPEVEVTVWVSGDPAITDTSLPATPSPETLLTPSSTAAPTSTTTATPTSTGTAVPTYTSTAVGLSFEATLSANEFHYGGCSPGAIEFVVAVRGGELDSVVLFLKLVEESGSGTSGWRAFNAMSESGDGSYRISVPASSIEGYDQFDEAWVFYQFVATLQGAVVGRSPSFTDLLLTRCGGGEPPVPIFVRPTPVP